MQTCAYLPCSKPFEPGRCRGRQQRYCSRDCRVVGCRDKSGSQCSTTGCDSPIRAKDLCSSHYNAQRRAAGHDYHRKVTVPCGYCNAPCDKNAAASRGYQARYCSTKCQTWARTGYCKVPDDHPVMALIKADRARPASRAAQERARIAAALAPRDCEDCGERFTPAVTRQIYCTYNCKRRVLRRARRGREFEAIGSFRWTEFIGLFLQFDRACAYCERSIDGQPEPDHVLALSRGGANTLSNILPCCSSCNSDKRQLTIAEWANDRIRRGLKPILTAIPEGDARYRHLVLREPARSSYRDAA